MLAFYGGKSKRGAIPQPLIIGELEMANFGWRKDIKVMDNDNKEVVLKLEYNAFSFIIYKNFTGNDLMADLMKIGVDSKTRKVAELVKEKKIETEEDILKLSPEEQELLFCMVDNDKAEIYMYILATLIASCNPMAKRSFEDIILNDVPTDFITDPNIMTAISEFIVFRVDEEKKKKNLAM